MIIDIHTSECPLEITAHNSGVTLEEVKLDDCAINGILNVYAVQRWTQDPTEVVNQGKAEIFNYSGAWKHPVGQTDRGISNLLSTLRVFSDLTMSIHMDDERQDAVLHMLNLLTHFPPEVRAAYILMRGETPRLSERAALSQCLYEALKKVVPLQIIKSDRMRLFEGSRLLFGLILEKAKNMKLSKIGDRSELPYLSMQVYDLRNITTMMPVLSLPVQTTSGLVDVGYYDAFDEGALLGWKNSQSAVRVSVVDQRWNRVATLSGGATVQVVTFNTDTIRSSQRYADGGDVSKIISAAGYTDLTYLASLCSRNGLTVVDPAELASIDAPVLTLDREGSLSVYVGREACGSPGRDILMFRPTLKAEAEAVDVSIITGLLEPILIERAANGTVVFEAYGSHHRRVTSPDEITMICVDLSQSMNTRCDFEDVKENEDAYADLQSHPGTVGDTPEDSDDLEDPAFHLPDPDELKEYLRGHESYDDFLAIVGTGRTHFHCQQNAEKVLQILQQHHQKQIASKKDIWENFRTHATQYTYRIQSEQLRRDLSTLTNRSLRLQKFRPLLCAWLITCADRESANIPDPLVWKPGDAIPTVQKVIQQAEKDRPSFEVPREYCCHISNEIMEDPVMTADDYTYDRRNIERWLQSNQRSPLTNLILVSKYLRPNVRIKEEIVSYISCADIISTHQKPKTTISASSVMLHLSFRTPLGVNSIDLPCTLKLEELWEIAFRLTKGRYVRYELQHRNAHIPASEDAIESVINPDHEIFINPVCSTVAVSAVYQEWCLVKVYACAYAQPVVSYWEPKATTKTMQSIVFKYYRQKFATMSSTSLQASLVFWIKMRDRGDRHITGEWSDAHWEPISPYFNREFCTGTLSEEFCFTKEQDDEDSKNTYDADKVSQPLVFKVYLGLDSSASKQKSHMTRLDVLKQMFDAYINRLLAYNFHSHVGLVTFSTKALVAQKITNAVENFRHKLNNLKASGDTAIWDSIALAQDQIQQYAEQYPGSKLRIICISDGEDNKSQNTAVDLASRLIRDDITVDSFCLDDHSNKELQTLCSLSGGYSFAPKTLDEAMAICEMEPVLSLLERPLVTNHTFGKRRFIHHSVFRRSPSIFQFSQATQEVQVQRVTSESCPARREHPELQHVFVELGHFARQISRTQTNNALHLNRIHTEIRNSGANPHPHYDIYICESNMGLWKVVMQGPSDSTYAGGTFLLYVKMGDNYPMSAPEARFITPIYHPNINRHGRICHSILDRNWTLDTSNKNVIDTIYSLLLVPEFSDPINAVVTLNYHWDEVQFKEEAQRHIQKHASKNRDMWRKDIVGLSGLGS
ncbi:hypothetical protein PTNB73_00081 [Pyrenophora teres f. teres]|nr:hypothetical protein PTNB73_00081 [Pyrenophora teres f. teres]